MNAAVSNSCFVSYMKEVFFKMNVNSFSTLLSNRAPKNRCYLVVAFKIFISHQKQINRYSEG